MSKTKEVKNIVVYPTETLLKMDLKTIQNLKDRVSDYDSRLWHVEKVLRGIEQEKGNDRGDDHA